MHTSISSFKPKIQLLYQRFHVFNRLHAQVALPPNVIHCVIKRIAETAVIQHNIAMYHGVLSISYSPHIPIQYCMVINLRD